MNNVSGDISSIKEVTASLDIELQTAPLNITIQSIKPNNVIPSGPLRIELSGRDQTLRVEITGCRRIETFIATVEDILAAIEVVEETTQIKSHQD